VRLINILIIFVHGGHETLAEETINSFTHPGYDLNYNLFFFGGEITKYISNNISLAGFGKAFGSWSSNTYPKAREILVS